MTDESQSDQPQEPHSEQPELTSLPGARSDSGVHPPIASKRKRNPFTYLGSLLITGVLAGAMGLTIYKGCQINARDNADVVMQKLEEKCDAMHKENIALKSQYDKQVKEYSSLKHEFDVAKSSVTYLEAQLKKKGNALWMCDPRKDNLVYFANLEDPSKTSFGTKQTRLKKAVNSTNAGWVESCMQRYDLGKTLKEVLGERWTSEDARGFVNGSVQVSYGPYTNPNWGITKSCYEKTLCVNAKGKAPRRYGMTNEESSKFVGHFGKYNNAK